MRSSLQIYCDKENLVEVRHFISDSLKKTTLSSIEISELILAVDEVCANIIIHSYQCNTNETLEVFAEIKENDIIFEVVDEGVGYDFLNSKIPILEDIVKSRKKGGVGLILIQKIMDEIDFISTKGKNTIRLIKHI